MSDFHPPTKHLAARAVRTTLLGLAINAVLAVVKGVTGVVGHSHALVADALESALDLVQGVIVFSGLSIASVAPDENHPYGHGKAEPLAAILAALMIMLGAVGIAWGSVHQIMMPDPPSPAGYTIVVLAVVIAVKEGLFRHVMRVGEEVGSIAVHTDAWHHRSDAFTSIAALLGISVALVGGPGYETADDWAALLACALIAYNGYRLLVPALHEVMDAAPAQSIEAAVHAAAQSVPGVAGTERCLVRKMGLEFYVDLHVCVDGDMTVRDGHDVAHRVKDSVRAAIPRVRDVLVHVEPEEEAGCGGGTSS
jgi:cation diffusion facilitator family transporter